MFVLISYDIEDDKRRLQVSKILENHGTRIQYSVFECLITKEQLQSIIEAVAEIIDVEKDSVRYYRICQSCVEKIEITGSGNITKKEDFYII
ncbi:MAG: CRISPR-associated endonuclease Cas2 [Candidatus Ratteibacteria bacterium]|jgi:CRISPR-associated protein Cas2